MIWRYSISLFLGALFGTFAFLCLASFLLGTPISDSLLSAHGVLIQNGKEELTTQQIFEVQQLLKKGMILSADGLISNMQSFYGNLITVLVSFFAALGVFSVVYAKWLSRGQIDDLVSDRTEHGLKELVGKKSFHDMIDKSINSALQIEFEAFEETVQKLDAQAASIQEFIKSTAIESSPEETNTVKARPRRKVRS